MSYTSSDEDYSTDDYEAITRSGCWRAKRLLNTEDMWAVYVGVAYYVANLGMSFWGIPAPRFYEWDERPPVPDASYVVGLISLVLSVTVVASVVHKSLGKPDDTKLYVVCLLFVSAFKFVAANRIFYRTGVGDSLPCLLFGLVAGWVTRRCDGGRCNGRCDASRRSRMLSPSFFVKVGLVMLAPDVAPTFLRVETFWKRAVLAWGETALTFFVILTAGRFVLKYDRSLLVAGGVAICGPPAVVMTADVIGADRYSVDNLIALTSILTVPLVSTMYMLNDTFPLGTGAWIGGSIDTIGGVVASASMIGTGGTGPIDDAVAVKILQTLFMCPASLVISAVWHRSMRIWKRFPRFMLAYVLVVVVTCFASRSAASTYPVTNNGFVFSEWFASLSVVSVGMNIDTSRASRFNFRMLVLYIFGQAFDLAATLGTAYLLYGR